MSSADGAPSADAGKEACEVDWERDLACKETKTSHEQYLSQCRANDLCDKNRFDQQFNDSISWCALNRPCGTNDSGCIGHALKYGLEDPKNKSLADACLAKSAECDGWEVSYPEDACSIRALGGNDWMRAQVALCLEKACDEFESCIGDADMAACPGI